MENLVYLTDKEHHRIHHGKGLADNGKETWYIDKLLYPFPPFGKGWLYNPFPPLLAGIVGQGQRTHKEHYWI